MPEKCCGNCKWYGVWLNRDDSEGFCMAPVPWMLESFGMGTMKNAGLKCAIHSPRPEKERTER